MPFARDVQQFKERLAAKDAQQQYCAEYRELVGKIQHQQRCTLQRKRRQLLEAQAQVNGQLLAVDAEFVALHERTQSYLVHLNEKRRLDERFGEKCAEWRAKLEGHSRELNGLMDSMTSADE